MLPAPIRQKLLSIVGSGFFLDDSVSLALYSYDAALDRATPQAVLLPGSSDEIRQIIEICAAHKIPFVVRAAATNLCGAVVPCQNAIVIAITRLKKIIEINQEKNFVLVEPGVPNLFLQRELARFGYYYAPDPASQKASTIGGNIGTNAGGPHCLKYGVTSQHVLGLDLFLPTGEFIQTQVQEEGPDWTGLFVGAEGTLGIVTKAKLRILPKPPQVITMLAGFPNLEQAIAAVSTIIAAGIIPACLEAMDQFTVKVVEEFIHAGYPTDAGAVLLIELDGSAEIFDQAQEVQTICNQNGALSFRQAESVEEREKLWEGRRGAYPALAKISPNVLVEDGAVPRHLLPEAARRMRQVADRHHVPCTLIFHAGDGNLHPNIMYDERDKELTQRVRQAGQEMMRECINLGGTLSGEHGIGIEKRQAMQWLFTAETLEFFHTIKTVLDPNYISNPDKLLPHSSAALATFPQMDIAPLEHFFAPQTEESAQAFFVWCAQNKKRIGIGSTAKIENADYVFSSQNMTKVTEWMPENFTVIVESGIAADALNLYLQEKRQKVLLSGAASLGAIFSHNPLQSPALREQILGMNIILASGKKVQLGARVVKNVAGYDAAKIFLGARGELGFISSFILKTYPINTPFKTQQLPRNPISEDSKRLFRKFKTALDPQNRLCGGWGFLHE